MYNDAEILSQEGIMFQQHIKAYFCVLHLMIVTLENLLMYYILYMSNISEKNA